MKNFLASTLLLAACLTGPQATAAQIYLTAPSTVVFNFDFAASGASLPASGIAIWFGIQRESVFNDGEVDSGWVKIFGDLHGTGDTIRTYGWSDTSYIESISGPVRDLFDGVFSIVYGATAGTMALDVPVAELFDASWTNEPARLEGVLANQGPTFGVPEPHTGPLAGLAVAAIAFLGRRRKTNA